MLEPVCLEWLPGLDAGESGPFLPWEPEGTAVALSKGCLQAQQAQPERHVCSEEGVLLSGHGWFHVEGGGEEESSWLLEVKCTALYSV